MLPGRDTGLQVQGMVRTTGTSRVQHSQLALLPKESNKQTNAKSFEWKHKKVKKNRQYKELSKQTLKQEAKPFGENALQN